MLKSGSITIIYCASTIDHIYWKDAEKIKLTNKLVITKVLAPFPADDAIFAKVSSKEPIWIWRGISVAMMNEASILPYWSMKKDGSPTKIIITSGEPLETRLASVKLSWMFMPFSLKSVMFQLNWVSSCLSDYNFILIASDTELSIRAFRLKLFGTFIG